MSAARLALWEGAPIASWRERWRVPHLEIHDRVGSTNDVARALAQDGAEPFTTVIADEQTAGRGRSGRSWHSPQGVGLWLSVVSPGTPEGGASLTPILTGVAVARAIREQLPGTSPGLEWPNDVVLDGRKVCGVLCEAFGDGRDIVVGVGINVRQSLEDFPEHLRATAGSLEMAAGRPVSRAALAGSLLGALRTVLTDPPERLAGELAAEVAELDVLAGERVITGTGARGTATGFAEDGALRVLDDAGREVRIRAGSVRRWGTAPRAGSGGRTIDGA